MKNSDSLVSIVIPVYNVEKYLEECLEAVDAQTYPRLEIILVDDGSTDGSGSMCNVYEAFHDNVTVIHQPNLGQSAARNRGVRASRGEYVVFVDSDDVISPDYVEYLMGLVREFGTRMAIVQDQADDIRDLGKDPDGIRRYIDTREFMPELCRHGCGSYSKIYERSLLEEFPYPEGMIYEDLATTFRIVGSCKGVALGSRLIYYYRSNPDSIVNGKFSRRHMDMLRAAQQQIEYMRKYYPNAEGEAIVKGIQNGVVTVRKIFEEKKPDRPAFEMTRQWMLRYMEQYLTGNGRDRNNTIYCLAIRAGYFPAQVVFRLRSRLKKIIGNKHQHSPEQNIP